MGCEFESHTMVKSIQYNICVLKFVSDLVVYSSFLHQWNWPPWYNWNIVESSIKHL